MEDREIRRPRLRQLDCLYLLAGIFAATMCMAMGIVLPGRGYVSFGAFMVCIVAASWVIVRQMEANRDK